jgi:hypothetical protein
VNDDEPGIWTHEGRTRRFYTPKKEPPAPPVRHEVPRLEYVRDGRGVVASPGWHYAWDGRVGFIPGTSGHACPLCGSRDGSAVPPLCSSCAVDLFGMDVLTPQLAAGVLVEKRRPPAPRTRRR